MVGKGRMVKVSTVVIGIILMAFAIMIAPSDVDAHAPESMELSYDYFTQILNVTIQHTSTPATPNHYINNIEVFKNNISVIQETYTEQSDLRDLYYEFEVFAEDGDILKAIATCSRVGEDEAEITVVGPKERMEITVNEIDYLEMGDEWDFTVNIDQENSGDPLDGVNVEVRAVLGDLSEVSELGIGGYSFTYTAPELQYEDVEVINITASRNGYHSKYYEFDFDIIFPVDDSKKILVTLSPKFSTIDEGESKEITATVTVKEGNAPLDIAEISVDRSGGMVNTESAGTGIFLITFRANEVGTDVDGWIKVTAEKEGYAKGTDQMVFKIQDTGDPVDDDDDDVGISNESDLFTPTNIIIIIVILGIIGGGVGFYIYRKRSK
jgi:desulfoferrodoxin (superoxide reductase-like protein)